MPEGDTILRSARVLHGALAGQRIEACEAPGLPRQGRELLHLVVARVTAQGKHLLLHLDDGRALDTHLGMHGSWHLYGLTDRWRAPRRALRIALTTTERVAVCFAAPVVRLLHAGASGGWVELRHLGPDLLAPELDIAVVVARLRGNPAPIGEVLLDQRLVAGLGNVLKSEALFLARVHPLRSTAALADEELVRLLDAARGLLLRNVRRAARVTTSRGASAQRHAVYRRTTAPCLVCGTSIESISQGAGARRTYYCPTCQPADGA